MRKILILLGSVLLSLSINAQTGITEEFNNGSLAGWQGNNFMLSSSGGELLIKGERTELWDAFDFNFDEIDMSDSPFVSLEIKSNFSITLAVGIGINFTDGEGNPAYEVFYPERIKVLPYAWDAEQEILESDLYQQYSYDFTGISYNLKDGALFNGITGPVKLTDKQILSAVSNLHFFPNPLGFFPGTTRADPRLFFDNIRAGSDAFNTPGVSTVPDQLFTIGKEGTQAREIILTNITDGADDTKSISVSATSSNDALIPDPVVSYVSGDRTGTLILSPNDNMVGESNITVTLSSPGAKEDKNMSFKAKIKANSAPIMKDLEDLMAVAGEPLELALLNIDDGNGESEQKVHISSSSSDVVSIPQPVVTFDQMYHEGTIEITPDESAIPGTVVDISVHLADDGGTQHGGVDSSKYSFSVSIFENINHPPLFEPLEDIGIPRTAGNQSIVISGISDGDDGSQLLQWTVLSSDENIVSSASIGPLSDGTALLSCELTGELGSSVITVKVDDDGGNPGNNGNAHFEQSFSITALQVPTTGLLVDFQAGGSPGDYGLSAESGYTLSIENGELHVHCNYSANSYPGMWWDLTSLTGGKELDLSGSPFMSFSFRNSTENNNGVSNETEISVMLWDADMDQAYLNTKRVIRTPEDGIQKDFFFDFSNSFYEDEDGQVDSSRINSVLINLDNRWFYNVKGDYWIDEIRMGDSVIFIEPPRNTINDIPDQVIIQGDTPKILLLEGISNGEGEAKTDLTYTVSNPSLVTEIKLGSISNGSVPLSYTLGAGSGSCEVIIVANNVRREEDIPDTTSFNIHVVDTMAASTIVTIDPSVEYQEFRGIGGVLSNDDHTQMINTINDLNWTMMRIFGDLDYIEPVNDNGDPEVTDRMNLVPNEQTLENIKVINENTGCNTFFYTPLTPPVWMKTNRSAFPIRGASWAGNNHIDPEYYDEFAEFLVEIVKMIKEKAGVELYAISIQNEPQFNEPYPSTQIFAEEFVEILKVAGPRFQAEGLNTKILMSEDVNLYGWLTDRVNAVNNNAASRDYLGVVGFHAYAANGIDNGFSEKHVYEVLQNLFQKTRATDLWMTESSGWVDAWEGAWGLSWDGKPQYMEGAFGVAGGYYLTFKHGKINGWTDLNSTEYIGTRPHLQAVTKHFTRFTNSGDVMIETSSDDSQVVSIAFKNRTTGDLAITILNTSFTSKMVALEGSSLPAYFRVITSQDNEPWKEQVPVSEQLILAPRSIATLHSKVSNVAPTIDPVANRVTQLNEGAFTVELSGITDGNPDQVQNITFTAISGDETVATVVSDYTSDNTSGMLTITPKVPGHTEITLILQDDGGTEDGGSDTRTVTFEVDVYQELNQVPTIAKVDKLDILEDAGSTAVTITGISDGDGSSQGLMLYATSSNPLLIPDPDVSYSNNQPTGTISLEPMAGRNGSATIFLTVADQGGTPENNGNQSTLTSFMVMVEPVNDAPTINPLANLSLTSYETQFPVSLEGIDDGDPDANQLVTVSATSSDESLVLPELDHTPGGRSGTLTLNLSEKPGTATITITLQDDGGIQNGGINQSITTFDVTLDLADGVILNSTYDIQVYPVPAENMISVSHETSETFTSYSIFDLNGIIMEQQRCTSGKITHIPVEALSPGTYLLKLDYEKGAVIKAFIKQ